MTAERAARAVLALTAGRGVESKRPGKRRQPQAGSNHHRTHREARPWLSRFYRPTRRACSLCPTVAVRRDAAAGPTAAASRPSTRRRHRAATGHDELACSSRRSYRPGAGCANSWRLGGVGHRAHRRRAARSRCPRRGPAGRGRPQRLTAVTCPVKPRRVRGFAPLHAIRPSRSQTS